MAELDAVFEPSAGDTLSDLAQLGLRLRDTLDTLREAVFQIDLDKRFRYLNAAWTELTERCVSESLGEPIEAYFWREDQAVLNDLLEQVLVGDAGQQGAELRIAKRDGTFIWIELRARVVLNETGTPIGVSGTLLNINDRRHTEVRLRESEMLFRAAFDLSPNGIAIYTVDRKFTQCNLAMCDLFGYSAGQLMTMDLYALLEPDDISQARKAIRRALSGKPVRGVELRCNTRDGRTIWVELSSSLLNAHAGEPAVVLLQLQDLSERKQTETDLQAQNQILFHAKGMLEAQKAELDQQAQQLQIARQIAEDANAAKTELLANVSHEIRTPISTIIGFTELLQDPTQTEQQHRECIDTIQRNGRHMLRIVDDILDVARIESGRMNLEYSDVQISTIVHEVVALMRPQARDRDVQLECEFAGGVPPQIRSDPVRLRQILLNLVSNAVKFTHQGSVKIVVDMSRPNAATGRRFLRLLVTDTGIGMSSTQLGKLFRAFEQADTTRSRQYGGVGLGLVITRRLVDLLGGTIEVTSAENLGTTFVVTLDVEMTSPEFEDAVRRMEAPPRTGGDEYPSLAGRVLLIEAGKDNQKLIGFLLRRCGLDVAFADSRLAAVDAVSQAGAAGQPFDLVLLDMAAPELGSDAAVDQMRRHCPNVPIVAVTASAQADGRERCLSAGCSDFLVKPIDRKALVRLVSRYLQRIAPAPANGAAGDIDQPLRSRLSEEPMMREILQQYISEMPAVVGGLRRALVENDNKAIHAAMYELKGSAGGYGFDELTALAGAAEASIRLGADRCYVEQSVNEVIKLLRRVEGYDANREAA